MGSLGGLGAEPLTAGGLAGSRGRRPGGGQGGRGGGGALLRNRR